MVHLTFRMFMSGPGHPLWEHWWRPGVKLLQWEENGIVYEDHMRGGGVLTSRILHIDGHKIRFKADGREYLE